MNNDSTTLVTMIQSFLLLRDLLDDLTTDSGIHS